MPTRPQRSDAAERRKAILAAAEIAFAERGLDVPLEEICQRAGVGRATLYRNFANRVALVHAIMSSNVDKLEEIAADIGDDPEGLFVFLREILDQLVRTGGLVYLIGTDAALQGDLASRYTAAMARLLGSAQASGRVRADIGVAELQVAVGMMWGGLENHGYADRQALAGIVFELTRSSLLPR